MKSDKLVIGLTGGIGSGKSAAAKAFSQLGVAVIDADIASRSVVEPGQPALAKIAQHFGDDVLSADKTLDRQKLRNLVFSSDENRLWLNNLLHPLIRKWMEDEVAASKSNYVIQVIPLLFEVLYESKLGSQIDRILVIDVPVETQIERVLKRDESSLAEIENIIQSQASRQFRLDNADDVISNNSTLAELELAVKKLHNKYLELAEMTRKKNNKDE